MNKRTTIKVLLVALIVSGLTYADSHFSPVTPTGLPYHVIVSNLTVNGSPVPAGTEIGVFDENLCVGSISVTSQGQTNLDIVAWQGNPSYNLSGFTVGHPMIFKVWIECFGDWQLLTANATFSAGDGNFGTGSYSSVTLTANSSSVPVSAVSPVALDFGSVTINQYVTKTFTITNTGTALLTISSLSSNNSQFTVGNYPENLNPAQSIDVIVTFQPNAAVLTNGIITINTDDPANPQKQISVTGQGIPLQQALIQVSPTSLSYGYVPVGNTVTLTILIQNTGNQPLTFSNIYSGNSAFLPLPTVSSIAVGESYNLPVEFTPTTTGSVSTNLTIRSNAGNTPNLSISMNGIGYSAQYTPVAETGLPYTIVIDNAVVDNHNLNIGDQVAVFDGELCVGMVVFSGSYPFQLVAWQGNDEQNLTGFTVGHPMTFKIWTTAYEQKVELTPRVNYQQGTGMFGAGEFTVASLTADSELEPLINAYERSLNFPPIMIGTQTTLTFTIENKGWSNLYVTDIISSNNAFRANPTNFTLPPLTNQTVTVTFQPTSAMPYTADLTIYSNDPSTPTIVVTATGQGLPATARMIQVSNSPIYFSPTKIGNSTSANLTLFNIGSQALTISNLYFSDEHFSTSVNNFQIGAGGSYNLPISFNPEEVGVYSGALTITNDSYNNPTIVVDLSGIGYEGYFKPVASTGKPYTVIIDNLILPELFDSQTGDEIGIYDGELCVGNIIIHSDTGEVSGTAWQADNSANLPGFNPGNPIGLHYFFRRNGTVNLYSLAYEIIEGDGNFGTSPFTSLIARIDREILPPDAPILINAIGRNSTVILNWQGNSEIDLHKYNIYRGAASPALDLIDSLLIEPNQPVNFIDDNVQNGNTYFYRITAVDTANNESNYSEELSAIPYGGPVWYIATTGNDSLNNGSEVAPFASIQHGINASVNGDTVIVNPGTYVENIRFYGKNIVVRSNEGALNTIIDGNQQNSVVIFFDGEDSTCVLDGFTIRNGVGSFLLGPDFSNGGGILCRSNPILKNLIIENNSAYGAGGIQIYYANPVLINCTIRNNTVVGDGGGIYLISSNAVIENVLIHSNTAGHMGAGIVCDLSNPSLKNVTIYRNTTSPHVVGAGLVISQNSNPVLINSIVMNNTPQNIYFYPEGASSSMNITYSNIFDIELNNNGIVTGNIGNINQDPLFINPGSDFHLSASSPCIDAGDPASDYSLEPAYNGRRINMGAYGGTSEATPSNPELSVVENLDFPTTGVDSTSFATLSIINNGTTRLNLDSLFEEADTTFILTDTLEKPYLMPDETAELSYKFSPLQVGQYTENLTLKTNDENESAKQVILRGMAVNYPPRIPTGLSAVDSIQAIKLTWNENTEGDFSHYNLYRGLTADFTPDAGNLIATILPPQSVFIDSVIQNAVTYYYKLTAVDTLDAESVPIIRSVLAVYLDIWDVTFNQRKDGSALVDVNFSFSGHDTTQYLVQPLLSIDDGNNWFELTQTSGEIGLVNPGINRHFLWDLGMEMPDAYYKKVKVKVIVSTR